jgi:hypothetical protein
MTTLSGGVRLAFLSFFASHIFVTLLMTGQTVVPWIYPDFMTRLLPFYVSQFNDTLMVLPFDLWFQSFVAFEVLVQVPFFVVAVHVLSNTDKYRYSGNSWFKTMCLVYGSHAATTLIPILATTLFNEVNSFSEKAVLLGLYFPYLLFPLWLIYICATNDDIFGGPKVKLY